MCRSSPSPRTSSGEYGSTSRGSQSHARDARDDIIRREEQRRDLMERRLGADPYHRDGARQVGKEVGWMWVGGWWVGGWVGGGWEGGWLGGRVGGGWVGWREVVVVGGRVGGKLWVGCCWLAGWFDGMSDQVLRVHVCLYL